MFLHMSRTVLVNNLIQGKLRDVAAESKGNITAVTSEWFVRADDCDFRLTDVYGNVVPGLLA